jgi:alkylated DNA nucleotide flippase Atl1
MTVMSMRAQAVARILWELKQADKIATLSSIAKRAGFSPGAHGQTIRSCMQAVRRDWSHLQWWRAIADDGRVDQEQLSCLADAGFEAEPLDDDTVVIKSLAAHTMDWDEPNGSQDDDAHSAARQG